MATLGVKQKGSSMVEFVIVLPLLIFLGMGTVQFALAYHAKSILNYATFEAARAGAVSNAQKEVMRRELGYRLAPIYGGDGSLKKGAVSLSRSMVAANDVTTTKIEILNPSSDSFIAHGMTKSVEDRHGNSLSTVVIPNSHLRFNTKGLGSDGLSIKDANLLKIRVTYGFQMRLPVVDMKLPGVNWVLRNIMANIDQKNWMYYTRGMLPMQATATVRMQSEAWEFQEEPPVVRAFESAYSWVKDQIAEESDKQGDDCEPVDEVDNNLSDSGLPLSSTVETLSVDACVGRDYLSDLNNPITGGC